MYKVCKPLKGDLRKDSYYYQGKYYMPTFYLDYKHLVNDLKLHYFYSNHESVVRFAQVTGNDCYGATLPNAYWLQELFANKKKEVYILDHDDKRVDMGLLVRDMELSYMSPSEKYSELTLENNKFQFELLKRQAFVGDVPNYFVAKSLSSILRNNKYLSEQQCEFRKDPIPTLFTGKASKEQRAIRYFSELKQASIGEDVVSLEEETGQRIQLKIRSNRSKFDLPMGWQGRVRKDSYYSKSWKTHSKKPKQWSKHTEASNVSISRYNIEDDFDEFFDAECENH